MKSKPEIPPLLELFEEGYASNSSKFISLASSCFLPEPLFFFVFLSSSDSLDELDEDDDCFLFFSFFTSYFICSLVVAGF
jgi:hypothetical protein